MSADGPAFYDDDEVFATYQAHRQRADNPNDTMETPVVEELVGDVRGRRVLDLGCGTGQFGRDVLHRGAGGYVGVEGSRKMAAAARETLHGTSARIVEQRVEDWAYPAGGFDLVVARLVLHYVADLPPLLARIAGSLVDGGKLILSVEHPVITSCARGWVPGKPREDWIVDDYFETGRRDTNWLGGAVVKYHRTVEDYFSMVQAAGLAVEQLREAHPIRDRFATAESYERRKRIPLFLIMSARKRPS